MVKRYYVSANTAQGYVDLSASNLEGLDIVELEGKSMKMNTEFLKQLLKNNKNQTAVEIWMSPISEQYIEGVIFREKNLAFLVERKAPFSDRVYYNFAEGLRIHDDLEKVYVDEMDFQKANKIADELIEQLLKNVPKKARTSYVFKRLLGTNTVDGVVNEVPNLTENLTYVYHIKGRAGTGKSTFVRRVASACLAHGLDLELYHCSFDPDSIDMVLIPELSICLFDSTDPHAFEVEDASREGIIDLYEEAVNPGTDEKYADQIAELTKRYKSYMKKGLEVLIEEGERIIAKDNEITFSQDEVERIVEKLQERIDKAN